MCWHEENSLPDIVELTLDREKSSMTCNFTSELVPELRASVHDLELDKFQVSVGVKRVWLYLHCDGLQVLPGERLGEDIKKIGSIVTKEKRQTTKMGFEAKGETNLDAQKLSGNVTASASARAGQQIEATETSASQSQSKHVIAKPNSKWLVTEFDDRPLSGTYLINETLCSLGPKENANRLAYELTVSVRKRDLWFEINDAPSGFFSKKKDVNKEKIYGVLLARVSDLKFQDVDVKNTILSLSKISYEAE